ncbi:putative TetR family transcriptional regulator [Actinacidiphila reveromycinica]|uniref:Putative TetR family transcriptional regulator n=1 Tax=Actinacidiphila reveromycinica TaxID=659352 RepID=A0A7U3USR3_9ACTN|nr:TetR/AcrR family transcriptional regulator [Streptomyces sp. SN-593]BBA98065.1 putative TetR family transcriptional regulator [Streptomyces sp. SN-593]
MVQKTVPEGPAKASKPAKVSARERLLLAADELFYAEGVQSVGIDRVIEHAGVAKASLYNCFGSKESLVRAYLEHRHERSVDRITRVLTRFRTPRERLLGMFDAQGELITSPGYNGCAFAAASAEAPPGGSVQQASDDYRAWMRGLFAELAAEVGVADPEGLARQLHLLYDGATLSSRMDRDPTAASVAREAAAVLVDAAPMAEDRDREAAEIDAGAAANIARHAKDAEKGRVRPAARG